MKRLNIAVILTFATLSSFAQLNIGIFKTQQEIKASIAPANDLSFDSNISESDTLNGVIFTSDYLDWLDDVCVEQSIIFSTQSLDDVVRLFENSGYKKDGDFYVKEDKNGFIVADIVERKNDRFEVEYISATIVADN